MSLKGTLADVNGKSLTIKSENGRDVTILDGMFPTHTGACVFVRQNYNLTLDGFTVRNGHFGAVNDAGAQGAGIAGEGAQTVTVHNCIFENNVGNYGGAIRGNMNAAGWWTVSNCVFRGNNARGSVMGLQNPGGYVVDCDMFGNVGNQLFEAAVMLEGCTIVSNDVPTGGFLTNVREIRGCTFISNLWGNAYGFNNMSNIEGCVIMYHTGPTGGLIHYQSGAARRNVIRNSVIAANRKSAAVTPVYADTGLTNAEYELVVENCTIARNNQDQNSAEQSGGITINPGQFGQVLIVNSIVSSNYAQYWASKNQFTNNILNRSYPNVALVISNSCVPGIWFGTDNTNASPRFVDAGNGFGTNWFGDLRLQDDSPCVDAGQALGWHGGAEDADELPRVSGAAVDMGAYEYQWPQPSGTLILIM